MACATDYYEALMLTRDAPPAHIRAAFCRLIADCHPDRVQSADAHTRAAAIIDAYRTLSRPDRRRAYDNRHCAGTTMTGYAGPERRTGVRRRDGVDARNVWQALATVWSICAIVALTAVASPMMMPVEYLPASVYH